MKYYLATPEVTQTLKLTAYRLRNTEGMYILSQADILTLDNLDGVQEITAIEAKNMIKQIK